MGFNVCVSAMPGNFFAGSQISLAVALCHSVVSRRDVAPRLTQFLPRTA
jgi:hypothetical protein